MKILLLRNEGCHIWQTAEKVLSEALDEVGFPKEYEIVIVKNNEEAKDYRFFGSPQITVDGKDIDPGAEKATQFQTQGCRFYIWQGKMFEYPPKEMIIEALRSHFKTSQV